MKNTTLNITSIHTLKKTVAVLFCLVIFHNCFAQNNSEDSVKLINWSAMDCDDTYDPYRIVNRITQIEKSEGSTKITVNFSENCCVDFEPTIHVEGNRLYLIPYTQSADVFCACDCCFSIMYDISGLNDKDVEIYFIDKKIEYSENYYDTVAPYVELYNGTSINRRNKYGFLEGTWMTFYEDCAIKQINVYPETVLFFDAEAIWSKGFYENGTLKSYHSKDTVQEWFEDGTIKYEHYSYSIGDTIFDYTFSLYHNRQVKEKSLKIEYPVVHKSLFNDCYATKGQENRHVYIETFYENGQRESSFVKDTTQRWYANGQPRLFSTDSKSVFFDISGKITEIKFNWFGPGTACSQDLRNILSVKYNQDVKIIEISLFRDEVREKENIRGTLYSWKWNADGELIKSPENWNEEVPWKRFKEIKIPRTKKKRR